MKLGRVVAPTGAGKSRAVEKYASGQKAADVHVVDIEQSQDVDIQGIGASIVILDHTHYEGGALALKWLEQIESSIENGGSIKGVILVGQVTEDAYWEDALALGNLVYSYSISAESCMNYPRERVPRLIEDAFDDCLHAICSL